MTTIIDKKIEQRKIFSKRRENLFVNNIYASKLILQNIKNFNLFIKSKIIASFISIKSEISTKFLNDYILSRDKILCLPVIDKKNGTLFFIKYDLNTKLYPGKYGVMEPKDSNKRLIPDIIFTPCLSFDQKGFRLGYGGGYYDKTFYKLKKNNNKFISVAVAFDEQKTEEVPHEHNDQKINYILTEKKLYRVL